ncbi:MAG: CDP-diacylglycerol--serine O-phosphatidyltransferase [Elusimicrobiota bacterium]|jgi:CDP-diacylglycerol--serine O-phosphatidyltransferase|nr:CDP-diacylglycerol--serine O-phosphatidyltransferase [Elusimicrobiota bacterium]
MKKGIYVLPTIFTLGNLVVGFLSLFFACQGKFSYAAWAIILAGIFDLLDGRIARLTNSVSKFGIELDSLCDIVSFGVAPAFLIHQVILFKYGKKGLAILVIYVVAAGLRLARFNTNALQGNEDARFFRGLPVPAAGYMLASFVLIDDLINNGITKKIIPIIMNKFDIFHNLIPFIILLISYAMVSNISYMSLKNLKLGKAKTFKTITLIFIGCFLVWKFPENMLFIVFLLYFLSGLIDVWRKLKRISENYKEKRKR